MKWIFIVMNFSEAFCISLIASTKKYGIFHTEKLRILFLGGFLWQDSYVFNDSQDWVNFLIVQKLGILIKISFWNPVFTTWTNWLKTLNGFDKIKKEQITRMLFELVSW